ncbi:hypothetical protein [Marinobacterium mangrovicola]|uniref:Uncharacterized protein n=1 Tax=Marinobacterium mangrovicola TaxID=1476959 RepID=A0A4R1GE08_9GAMM|nr:hypothetical protein [Marinobacterium mangrovicola]TCK06128.1 hypothetical protein CLV83_3077 [Marinobacterium mangrovicola]
MHAKRDLDPLNDDPNTYDLERDGPIDMPVTEALALAERILHSKSDDEIHDQLVKARAHAKVEDCDNHAAFEHAQVRITFLALNFAANQRRGLAPVYRERLRASIRPSGNGPKQPNKLIDIIYSLDRQLIDLHWLYCREVDSGNPTSPKVDGEHIWLEGEFNPAAAERFVQQEWGAPHKVKTLQIIEADQLELGVLRSKKVRDRHYEILKRRDSDLLAIKDYCINNRQLSKADQEPMYNDLLALRLSRQDVSLAAQLRRSMGDTVGIAQSNEAIQRRLRRRKLLFKDTLKRLR